MGIGMGAGTAIREAAFFRNVDGVIAINPCGQPEKLRPWWWNFAANISLTTSYGKIPIRILSDTRIDNRYQIGLPIDIVDKVSPIPLLLIYDKSDRYLNDAQVLDLYKCAHEPKKMLSLRGFEPDTIGIISNWLGEALLEKSVTEFSFGATNILIDEIDIDGDILIPERMLRETIRKSIDKETDIDIQLSCIKENIEKLYYSRGYTLSQASKVQLSNNGRLSINIKVDKIDKISITGNSYLSHEEIEYLLGIPRGYYYNTWETELALKRLSQNPVFDSVAGRLEKSLDENILKIAIKERNPISLGLDLHTARYDKFGGIKVSLNEYQENALRIYVRTLMGIKHGYPIGQIRIERGLLNQEAFSLGLTFEKFYHSWDNVDYYFARQEIEERGGGIDISYKLTDNAKMTAGLYRKYFFVPDRTFTQSNSNGFINFLSVMLADQGNILLKGKNFFVWNGQIYSEFAEEILNSDYAYRIFQININPKIIFSPKHVLDLGIHYGKSLGSVPMPKCFSLGGDKTLPGYHDDTFVDRNMFLLRTKYVLKFGKWLDESSRLEPLSASFMLDIGDVFANSKRIRLNNIKYETGLELDYASTVRIGFVKGLGKNGASAHVYLGWNTHLIRPKI